MMTTAARAPCRVLSSMLLALLVSCGGSDDAPEAFPMRARVVGEFAEWRSLYVPAQGPESVHEYREQVFRVDAGGAWLVTTGLPDQRPYRYTHVDHDDNPIEIDDLSYDDAGMDYHSICRYEPPLRYFAMPLHIGKAWQAVWRATHCVDALEGDGRVEARVEARESVTVAAGTFDTLRIRLSLVSNGDAGVLQGQDRVCAWAIQLARLVRCEVTLLDPDTGAVLATVVDELLRRSEGS